MIYIATAPAGGVEYFDGELLGENQAGPDVFQDGQGSQALIALRLLLASGVPGVSVWNGYAVSAGNTRPDPSAGKDITVDLLTWFSSKPGNPLKFRDPVLNWMPDAEASRLLDGLTKITQLDDLRRALGRIDGPDPKLEILAWRLAERNGIEPTSLKAAEIVSELTVEPVLAVTVNDKTVNMPYPFAYPALSDAIARLARPEFAWEALAGDEVLI